MPGVRRRHSASRALPATAYALTAPVLMNFLLSAFDDAQPLLYIIGLLLFAALFVLGQRRTSASTPRSVGWLLTRVAVVTTAMLGLIAGLNYLVNPFGIYATQLFEPVVLHSRAEKMRLYRAIEPTPEIVVMGNSSSFTMSPSYIRERTGRPAFNASLHGGEPDDYLAFLRYTVAIRKVPSVVIVPLSVEALRPDLPSGFEPHNPLAPFMPGSGRHRLEGVHRLLTVEQTVASLRVLAVERRGRPPSHYRFDPDGWAHFATTNEPLERIVDSYLATKEWSRDLFAFHTLNQAQLSSFREFLELARHLGVSVIVYVPPLYPRALAFYERETNLPALRAQLIEHLRTWRGEGLIASVHDFSHLESFGGAATEFHDLAHPTAQASRRMLDLMLPMQRPSS